MNTFNLFRPFALITSAMLLASCAVPPPRQAPASTTAAPAATAAPQSNGATTTLTVMTHDSFDISEDALKEFEQANNAKVTILKSGDAGAMLNKAILSKGAPLADVIYGIDNTFMGRALASDILDIYASPALANIPDKFKLDGQNRLLPVDYGYVSLNVDKAYLADKKLSAPTSLRDLTKPDWAKRVVVESPATSSPGMAFLLATIAAFPEGSDYPWQQYWADLKKNGAKVAAGWSDAYYTDFSGSSGKGPYPVVLSYATSPAAEVFYSEGKLQEPPTDNLDIGAFEQVEFVGILKGSKNRALAEKWVDFMLGPTFQKDFPTRMWVYPVAKDTPLPEVFSKFAPVPKQVLTLTPDQIDANREKWLQAWTNIGQ